MNTDQPRGIRNNNPGNIERTRVVWEGMAARQTDERYINFKTPEYGIRAMARILRTYRERHDLFSIDQIINRWAPPVENNTLAYVDFVEGIVGVRPFLPLSFDDEQVALLIEAIIQFENGQQPYTRKTILAGIELERAA